MTQISRRSHLPADPTNTHSPTFQKFDNIFLIHRILITNQPQIYPVSTRRSNSEQLDTNNINSNSVVVIIRACHARDPGSIPGWGEFLLLSLT